MVSTQTHTAKITVSPADVWSAIDLYGYACTCGAANIGARTATQARSWARFHGCIGMCGQSAATIVA